MASKVNVRFVILLSVVLGVVFVAVAGTAAMVLYKSPEELASKAEAAADEGDFKKAALLMSKAVNKDRANPEYIERWGELLTQKVPDTETEFRTDYFYYRDGVLRGLVNVRPTDVEAHHAYLKEHFEGIRLGSVFDRDQWERLIELTRESLKRFELSDDPGDEYQKLRRFRGMALVRIMIEGLNLEEGRDELAREDLEAALAVDPSDSMAAKSLAAWHFVKAEQANKRDETERAEEAQAQAREILRQAAEVSPDDPDITITVLRVSLLEGLAEAQSAFTAGMEPAQRRAAVQRVVDEHVEELKRIGETMLANAQERTDIRTIDEFYAVGRLIDVDTANHTTREMLSRVLERDPENFDALMFLAALEEDQSELEKALDYRTRITQLDPLPVGLDGFRLFYAKRESYKKMADIGLALAQMKSENEEFDEEMLAIAREARDELAKIVPEGHEALLFLDAKFAIAEGDLNAAFGLLVEHRDRAERPDDEAVRLLGDVAARSGMPGVAREAYQDIISRRRTDRTTREKLAELEIQLGNYEAARKLYEEIQRFAPNDPDVKNRLEYVGVLAGGEGATVSDPIVASILDAHKIARGNEDELGDISGALERIDQGIDEHGEDARLIEAKAKLLVASGKRDEAIGLLRETLESQPESQSLSAFYDRLNASTGLEALLQLIDREETDELTKLIRKASGCVQFNEYERSNEYIDAAMELAPTDARVVQLAFFRAQRSQNVEEMRRLWRIAAEHDVDRAGGDVFRAYVQLAEGDPQGAAESLKQGVSRGTATAAVWRLKGEVENSIGRGSDAVLSFEEALRIDPGDTTAIIGYVSTLRNQGQFKEALSAARAKESVARARPEFLDLWLTLEAEHGDRGLALSRREQWVQRDPTNISNRIALARLYTKEQRWSDAREVIDGLKSETSDLSIVSLDADWHADQGDMQGARAVFESHIEGLDDSSLTAAPFLAFGRFLIGRGEIDEGLATLDQALEHADDVVRVSLTVGDEYARTAQRTGPREARTRRYEKALEAYERVLASMDDSAAKASVTKRVVETLLRLERDEEAEQRLAELGQEAESDLVLLLLRAEILSDRGDIEDASRLLNRAAAAHRDEPIVYFRRARLYAGNPKHRQDVLQDLATALQIEPDYWPALRLRAAVNFNSGNVDAAIRDLRVAVDAHPEQDDLRQTLLGELLNRQRIGEAVTVADQALERRPGEWELAVGLGDKFAEVDAWSHAARYYATAWSLTKNEAVLERYAESLLSLTPADVQGAQRALQQSGLNPSESAAAALVRAKIRASQNDMQGAATDGLAAFELIPSSRSGMIAWHDRMSQILEPIGPGGFTNYLVQVQQRHPTNPWAAFFVAQRFLSDEATRQEGVSIINQLVEHPRDEVRLVAYQWRSRARYLDGNVEQAIEDMKAGLEVGPGDPELNNNLAYLLINELDRVEEALPYAERAAQAKPFDVNILDTLGYVYTELGQFEDAESTLNRALRLASSPADRATVLLRLAKLRVEQGAKIEAFDLVDEAQEIINDHPELAESRQQSLDELMQELQ